MREGTFGGFEANTLYHYRVKSTDAAGNSATSGDLTFTTATVDAPPPRIAYWWGKVNQHTEDNVWMTDADGRSGANLDKLEYCRKFHPSTTGVTQGQLETITGWRSGGNAPPCNTRAVMTDVCVQPK